MARAGNAETALDGRLDILETKGHYLTGWNASTGLPVSLTNPYTYKAGDSFKVTAVVSTIQYRHSISVINSGLYAVYFEIINSSSTPFTTESAIQFLIDNGHTSWNSRYPATGMVYCDPYKGQNIIGVIKHSSDERIFAFLESTSGLGVHGTFTDTVSMIANKKPSGSSYNGTASSTTETGPVAIGDTYFYNGSTWNLEINHDIPVSVPVQDVTLNGTSVVSSGTAAISAVTGVTVNGTAAPVTSGVAAITVDKVKKSSITIPVASWTGSAPLFSQVISVTGATANTKVDIQPDSASIDLIKANGCTALYTVNDNGTITAYAKDFTPSADITVQITLTEVTV